MNRLTLCFVCAVLTAVLAAGPAAAQPTAPQPSPGPPPLNGVGIDQQLGAAIDLNLPFRDESGKTVHLKDFFRGKPVILAPVYFMCTSLCPMTLNSLVESLRVLKFNAGRDFDVVAFSFDPKETPQMAAAAKAHYFKDYDRAGTANGWHFLTGEEASIHALTETIGFHYVWDTHSSQWAHATAIIVATPEGRVGQYFYGLEYSGRDLRLSLVQASSEKLGTIVDRVLLYCYHYDPVTGKYGLIVMRTVRIVGTLTALALFGFMYVMFRRDTRAGRA
jgi:protein SCO1